MAEAPKSGKGIAYIHWGNSWQLRSFRDFRHYIDDLVYIHDLPKVDLSSYSAVVMPEVFLKAFAVAQNLGANLNGYTTVTMDMTAQYRAGENVVRRPAGVAGKGYALLGRHELMLPVLAQAVVERLD